MAIPEHAKQVTKSKNAQFHCFLIIDMTITITPATKVANNNSIFVNKPAKRILSNR